MAENKLTNCLLAAILIMTTTMFVWTINTIISSQTQQFPTAISAFSA